ncbi:unnamed protein product [Rotaria socialis]|uniref:Cytochrome P450 n=1 Tax=Rotaria socialis TaxID=392032 RepID=A0A821UZS3_9BILA|nr:unnamed protein product [Rotaria socialis]
MHGSYRKLVEVKAKTATRKIVEEYLKNPNANGEITSYMDAFYQQMLKDSKNNDKNSAFDAETLVANIHGLFQGGSDDGCVIKRHGLFLMAMYPEIQAKVQQELDEVVGRNRLPSVIDRPSLSYTEAVLSEILRYTCIIPATPIHMTEVETTIGGYQIPKDAACIANLFNATRDKRFFKNPEEFDPNNFLDENGKFVRNEANIPFSMGPRNCIGEPLLKMTFFLFMTAILQNYNLNESPNNKLRCETIESVVRELSPYEICAKKRI